MENRQLKKDERLHYKKEIEQLFTLGHTFVEYPFRIIYHLADAPAPPVSLLISIPKKRFKRAVWRNRLRRRTREAYRCNKTLLWPHVPPGKSLHLALLYISRETAGYPRSQQKIQDALTRMARIIRRTPTPTDENP